MMEERNCEPEQFEDRIIFISMYNDIEWDKKGNKPTCIANSESVSQYATRFPKDWLFLGPGCEEKKYGRHTCKPEGQWKPEEMMGPFQWRAGTLYFGHQVR